jgi:hypothetical protein
MLPAMNAPDAEARITVRRNAILHRRCNVVTPLNWANWRDRLTDSGLLDKYYPHIPSSIRFGFNIGFPSIRLTNTARNSPTMLAHADEFNRLMQHQRANGEKRAKVRGGSICNQQTDLLSLTSRLETGISCECLASWAKIDFLRAFSSFFVTLWENSKIPSVSCDTYENFRRFREL